MEKSKLMLTALLSAGLATAAGAAGFEKTNAYTDGQFTDVPNAEWYANEVKSTYELGLMNGIGGGLFDPEGNVTVAEAITMAARAAAINAGAEIPAADGEWYQMYVNYGIASGFVKEGQFDNYDRPAKRHEVASLFENAMPDGYFTAKNDVDAIPDVSGVWDYQEDLLTLYKAGVVMGSDSYGNFRPEDNITRAEAAAIINRVALPENRLSKTLDKISTDDAYEMSLTYSFNASKEGLTSGWILDNRGGTPRTTLDGEGYGTLSDISTTAGTALIREFNKTSTGVITVLAKANLAGYDGVYLEFRNDKDQSIYRIQTIDGDWKILGADGNYTTIYEVADGEAPGFSFVIEVDLDNDRATTYINDKNCGTHALQTTGEDSNILNFRYATTEESTATCSAGYLYAYGNYSIYEDFEKCGQVLPVNWTGSDIYAKGGFLNVKENGYAMKAFNPVSGNVVVQDAFLLPNKENTAFYLRSGEKVIAEFKTDADAFYVNDVNVYDGYYKNLWYRMRLEANTDTQTITVKINSRVVAEVPFKEAATSADNIMLVNSSASEVKFDDFKLFKTYEREDYVPEPVVPAGEDKYIVGMNVCSLWRNEAHFGWACESPYEDNMPVLGYYDEGNVETADWELKYIIEHGIDFQAFCIYSNSGNNPQKLNAPHLFDAYMNAKYSDMSKFCVIWETGNASSPSSMDNWKNDYVPYFIETLFKDPRYMTIDNKPVFCVFGSDKIAGRLGGTDADVKKLFDYMEEEVKKLGFDGMIYLACGSSSNALAERGFDGCYAYNWGTDGAYYNVNVNSILSSAKQGAVYTVPTISVGFNSIPWHGIRYPMMSKEDFAKSQEWVKNEYLTTYPTEDWQQNFVMISTWNEYGEGTYIMPAADEKGFQYLDVLREAYTDEKEDASINTVPTAEQRARINHLYPQYRHLLRRYGFYSYSVDESLLETKFKIDYSNIDTSKFNIWSIPNWSMDENGISGTTGGDAIIQTGDVGVAVNLDEALGVRVTLQAAEGQQFEVYFTTTTDTAWNSAKGTTAMVTSSEMTEYFVSFENNTNWRGELLGLRVDPVAASGQDFVLKSIEVVGVAGSEDIKKMIINDNEFEMYFKYEKASNGDTLVAFDPDYGMDHRLNTFHVWDRDAGVLTLNFANGHVLVFTVGSDKYTLDGKEVSLGYKLEKIDGLPLLPIKKICEDVGYKYEVNEDGVICIETDEKEFFDQINNREFAVWNFDTIGDTEKWASTFMSLIVNDGYMACESISSSTDPTILLGDDDFALYAKKYNKIEYRVRYEYNSDSLQQLTMYFITDKDKTWSESKTLKISLKGNTSNGEWEEYSLDISELAQWKDTIVDLRFDPFNATGKIDIDYIRFVVDPEMADYDPDNIPFTIKNGDAEDTSDVAFYGTKNIKIVEDPDDSSNHCYVNYGNMDGSKQWVYYRQDVTYTPGATYKCSADIRICNNDTNMDLDDDFPANNVFFNAKYTDSNTDHAQQIGKIAPSYGWVHCEWEFTIPTTSRSRGDDQFTFFSNPENDLGVGYYLDNVVVEEIKPEK